MNIFSRCLTVIEVQQRVTILTKGVRASASKFVKNGEIFVNIRNINITAYFFNFSCDCPYFSNTILYNMERCVPYESTGEEEFGF